MAKQKSNKPTEVRGNKKTKIRQLYLANPIITEKQVVEECRKAGMEISDGYDRATLFKLRGNLAESSRNAIAKMNSYRLVVQVIQEIERMGIGPVEEVFAIVKKAGGCAQFQRILDEMHQQHGL